VRYGDRILVLKYLYIPWISSPHRWDVVVFKTPTDRPAYAINYIKRLIGLPGEELMILDGDVYVKMGNAWQIQTKPKFAQDALWRIIYDNDYRPLNQNRSDGWTLPWVHNDGDGWDTGNAEDARVIVFNNKDGGGRLRFDPTRDPRYNPQSAPGGYFTDWLAYDATMGQDLSRYASGDSFASEGDYMVYTVSDLKLQFFYDRKAGDGPLMARMTKLNHEFVLTFTPDAVRLKHTHGGDLPAEIPPLHAFVTSKARGPIKVEFSNVDYQVSVRLNGELIFQTTPQQYHPDVKDLLARHERRRESRTPFGEPSVTIDAARQQALLSHVSLWRDVYYTPEDANGRELVHGRPRDPVKLGGDDYFVMGDNSAASYDARFWTDEIHLPDEGLNVESGRVPGRFMLGRAFFVYWPAGYRPFERAPALVPDFGDMRLIH
jgi:signal peptidase I